MAGLLRELLRRLRRFLSYIWGYLGTLSAMGLLLGVLGMGLYYVYTDEASLSVRCYTGMSNPAAAVLPEGLGELPFPGADAVKMPHMRFEYDKGGKLLRVVHVDAAGAPAHMPGSRVAEQRMRYDAAGRLVSRSNYNEKGQPVADASGVSVREFEYDRKGRLVASVLKDARHEKVVPRMPGFAEARISYDEKGRPSTISYLDGNGKALTNAAGESVVTYTYNDSRNEVLRSNYENGKPMDNADGVATELVRHTEDGRVVHTSWRNSRGEPVQHEARGAHAEMVEYMPGNLEMRVRRCGQNGVMLNNDRVWAEHLVRTTPAGSVEWECFNGADGLPCQNPERGYAERVCEYGPEGELETEFFWDERGNPSKCYEKRYTGDHVLSLHTDGSTEVRRLKL